MTKVFITSALRTAVGSLGKSLKNVNAEDLGSAVITKNIVNSNFVPEQGLRVRASELHTKNWPSKNRFFLELINLDFHI